METKPLMVIQNDTCEVSSAPDPDDLLMVLIRDFRVQVVWPDHKRKTYMVPQGFRTDFFSVPWVFRRFFPKWDRGWEASVLHDWFYQTQPVGVSRELADYILLLHMEELRVGWLKRKMKYHAVRIGGWRAWNRREETILKERGVK